MGLSVYSPQVLPTLGQWVDHTASLQCYYDTSLWTNITKNYSRYVMLTPKTCKWQAGVTFPAGTSGAYAFTADLPFPSVPGPGGVNRTIGDVGMIRPGVWYATGVAMLIAGAIGNSFQRVVFYGEYGSSNLMGSVGGYPADLKPSDAYWWDVTYEIA